MSRLPRFYKHHAGVLRDDDGSEPCPRCGTPTKERAFANEKGHLVMHAYCPRCPWARPAAPTAQAD